jgi:outer membrane protein assembly factor BamA
MAKLKLLVPVFLFLTVWFPCRAQSYSIHYGISDGPAINTADLQLDSVFPTRNEASIYIVRLPDLLQSKGYLTASLDTVRYGPEMAQVMLFVGEKYEWASIRIEPQYAPILQAVQWPPGFFTGNVDFASLKTWQQKVLDYFEDNGHPFGRTFLDSISVNGNRVEASLKLDPGPLYHIDSIRVYGDARISNDFLQRYLQISNGSPYSKKKLRQISKKIAELNYVSEERPSDISLLGTGSVINLYLKSRKTSQANGIIGFQPGTDAATGATKLQVTADVNVLFRNPFGSGETIGVLWQQLQKSSPRLNLLFDRPYVFHSPFGFNFSFNMFKRDSSYLNINMNIGTSYQIEERQSATIFLQRSQSIVSTINTSQVIQSKELPQEGDVSSTNLGVGYTFNNTDYRLNPRKGFDLNLVSLGGTKKIKKNNEILELEDPQNPSYDFEHLYDTVKLNTYQLRVTGSGSGFIPLGTQSTLRVGLNAGFYQSASYFRNELFQIGGFRILRGFDEESQFVSQYAIGTLEYRIRLQQNSFIYAFADGGWGRHILEEAGTHTYFGTGIGGTFESKAGLFNIAVAVGRRDDIGFNLRQPKVHIGFSNFF